ncbi:MAG: hypothetical protein ACRDZR_02300 [Acidimicrobiales bacterium]
MLVLSEELNFALGDGDRLFLGEQGTAEVAAVGADRRTLKLRSLEDGPGALSGVTWESPYAAMREMITDDSGALVTVRWHAAEWGQVGGRHPEAICGFGGKEDALTPIPTDHWRRVDLGRASVDDTREGQRERCAACLVRDPIPPPWGAPRPGSP